MNVDQRRPTTSTCPPHVDVSTGRPGVRIRGRLRSGNAAVFVMLGVATLGGLLFVTVSPRADANPRNAVAVLLTTAALLAAGAAALAFRLEQVTIEGDDITQEKSLAGIPWMRRRMARDSVDTLRVQTRGAGGHGLAIIGRQGRLLVGSSLDESELEWLQHWIEARLRQR